MKKMKFSQYKNGLIKRGKELSDVWKDINFPPTINFLDTNFSFSDVELSLASIHLFWDSGDGTEKNDINCILHIGNVCYDNEEVQLIENDKFVLVWNQIIKTYRQKIKELVDEIERTDCANEIYEKISN